MYQKERNIMRALYMNTQGLDSFKVDLGVIPGNEQLAPYSDEMEQFNPSDFPEAEREGIDLGHNPVSLDFSRSQIPNSENLDQVPPSISLLRQEQLKRQRYIPHNIGFRSGQNFPIQPQSQLQPQQPFQLPTHSPYPYSPPLRQIPLTTHELEAYSSQQADQMFSEHGARRPSPYGGNMKKTRKSRKYRKSKKTKRRKRRKRRFYSRKN
jgi:hypothetical protein